MIWNSINIWNKEVNVSLKAKKYQFCSYKIFVIQIILNVGNLNE